MVFIKTSNLYCIYLELSATDNFFNTSAGDTVTDNDSDLSIETLASDVGAVLSSLYKEEEDTPPVIIMGHRLVTMTNKIMDCLV